MTNKEKWQYLFRKDMGLRFRRADAYWAFGETFYDFKIYALKEQLIKFFQDWAGIERALRDVLKEPEFALPPEVDKKRYEKEQEIINRDQPNEKP